MKHIIIGLILYGFVVHYALSFIPKPHDPFVIFPLVAVFSVIYVIFYKIGLDLSRKFFNF